MPTDIIITLTFNKTNNRKDIQKKRMIHYTPYIAQYGHTSLGNYRF